MSTQIYYFIGILAVFGIVALIMSISVKNYNKRMAAQKSKRPRRR